MKFLTMSFKKKSDHLSFLEHSRVSDRMSEPVKTGSDWEQGLDFYPEN